MIVPQGDPSSLEKRRRTTLVLRALSGMTSELAHLARTSPKGNVTLDIEGPYGSANYFPHLSNEEEFPSILLVAGGVGATFALPIYKDLLKKRGGRGVRFIWCVRHKEDADWGRELLDLEAGWVRKGEADDERRSSVGMVPAGEGATIFITSEKAPSSHIPTTQGTRLSSHREDSLELEERSTLLETPMVHPSSPNPPLIYHSGRPNIRNEFANIVANAKTPGRRGKVAVLVCGPKTMARDLRREVGWWVRERMLDVWWHEEGFGWG